MSVSILLMLLLVASPTHAQLADLMGSNSQSTSYVGESAVELDHLSSGSFICFPELVAAGIGSNPNYTVVCSRGVPDEHSPFTDPFFPKSLNKSPKERFPAMLDFEPIYLPLFLTALSASNSERQIENSLYTTTATQSNSNNEIEGLYIDQKVPKTHYNYQPVQIRYTYVNGRPRIQTVHLYRAPTYFKDKSWIPGD